MPLTWRTKTYLAIKSVEDSENLVSDVVLAVVVHNFLDDQVILFGFGYHLDGLVGLVQNLLQFFIAAAVQFS